MSGLNRVLLIGNLGKEPEIKHLEGGYSKASFPLATTENYKNKDGVKQEQTEWHTIVAWRALAESIEKLSLKKGTMLYVEGKIRNRTYEDKDGNKKSYTEINADTISVIKRPILGEGELNHNHEVKSAGAVPDGPVKPGDLPF